MIILCLYSCHKMNVISVYQNKPEKYVIARSREKTSISPYVKNKLNLEKKTCLYFNGKNRDVFALG